MPHARLDDRWHDHKKIKRALRREPAAVALHAMAITYSNQFVTDGEVEADWISERLAMMPYRSAQRNRILALLLELCLLEQIDAETYRIHDFLDWNLSRAQRQALAEQGRRGGRGAKHSPGGSSPPTSHRSSEGLSQGLSEGLSTPRHATPTPTPRQVARKRVDQATPPEDFPDELNDHLTSSLARLRGIWDVRGGREPQQRGVALAMMRNPRADHPQIARKLEHWLTAGNGQRAECKDVTARFGDWVEQEPAAARVVSLNTGRGRRQSFEPEAIPDRIRERQEELAREAEQEATTSGEAT